MIKLQKSCMPTRGHWTRGLNPLSSIIIIVVLMVVVGIIHESPLLSAIPRMLNYQGKLLDSAGVGINDTLDITFKLYNASTDGNLLWQETINNVEILKGLFSVELGASDNFDTLSFAQPYWLEIAVASEILSPREYLTSVPYAFTASTITKPSTIADSVLGTGGVTVKYAAGEDIAAQDAVYLPGALTGWPYRQPITLVNSTVTALQYQVKITISSENTDFWDHRYSPIGADVRFTDTDGSSLLNFWRESFIDSAHTAEFWVKVPSIPTGSKTIYLYYGNNSATDASDFDNTFTKEYGTSGLSAVWHMDEGTGEIASDNSGNGNHGTFVNSPTWETTDGGQWDSESAVHFTEGHSLTFDGSNYVDVSHSATLNLSSSVSLIAWVKGSGNIIAEDGFEDTFADASYVSYQDNMQIGSGDAKIATVPWYNSSWAKRRPITITNGGSSLTDYQVKVDVTYDSDMQTDFDDLRFTTSDGTELNYWIESSTPSSSATVWVKVSSIPNGGVTIYMYYGNPSASSASNGTNTFEFFDDFTSNTTGNYTWHTTDTNSPTNSHNWNSTNKWVEIRTGDNDNESPSRTVSLPSSGYAKIDFIKRADYPTDNDQFLDIKQDDNNYYRFEWQGSGYLHQGAYKVVGGSTTDSSTQTGTVDSNGHEFTVEMWWTPTSLRLDIDGITRKNVTTTNTTELNPSEFYFFNSQINADWEFIEIRKYASPEPTTSVGDEQEASPTGALISTAIAPPNRSAWGIFSVDDNLPSGTSVQYSILNGSTDNVITGYENVTDGTDLSGITASSLKLKAVLTSNTAQTETPTIHSWGVSWTNLASIAKGGSYGFGPMAGDTLVGYINGKLVKYDSWNPSTWNHIAFTYDGATMRLYYNGSNVADESFPSSIITNTENLTIGKHFTGTIDEVRVYNTVLTDDKITCQYERRKYLDTTPTQSIGGEEAGESSGLRRTSSLSSYATDHFLGFALTSGAVGDSIPVRISGVTQGFTGLEIGSEYYLSDSPGAISTGAGTIPKRVGIAIGTDKLLITR